MQQVNIILPITQHNGTSNQPSIERIQNQIAVLYGGYTAMPVYGAWYDQETGEMYRDSSVMVSTFVETDQDVDAIRSLAPGWATWLQQISLTVSVHPVQVSFVEGTRAQDRAHDVPNAA